MKTLQQNNAPHVGWTSSLLFLVFTTTQIKQPKSRHKWKDITVYCQPFSPSRCPIKYKFSVSFKFPFVFWRRFIYDEYDERRKERTIVWHQCVSGYFLPVHQEVLHENGNNIEYSRWKENSPPTHGVIAASGLVIYNFSDLKWKTAQTSPLSPRNSAYNKGDSLWVNKLQATRHSHFLFLHVDHNMQTNDASLLSAAKTFYTSHHDHYVTSTAWIPSVTHFYTEPCWNTGNACKRKMVEKLHLKAKRAVVLKYHEPWSFVNQKHNCLKRYNATLKLAIKLVVTK